ncbi:MAG TPA: lipopolysaccharide transport periplasmic protein LptA [Gammaproteobacteria bacterium]|nr:lipopolysaccharide transport periplasmic protein LptA [Gammaproteobacteria bacterium]
MKSMRMRRKSAWWLCLWMAWGAAHALSTDKDQPIEIEADTAQLDKGKQVTIYTGNVVVVQGSIRMTGDKLTVYYDDSQQLKDAFLDGHPAYFKQRPDGKKEDFEGWALKMEYHAKENLLHLIDQAKLKQGDQVMTGARISYDTQNSVLTARGAAAVKTGPETGKAGAPSGRVKIIIPPKKKP